MACPPAPAAGTPSPSTSPCQPSPTSNLEQGRSHRGVGVTSNPSPVSRKSAKRHSFLCGSLTAVAPASGRAGARKYVFRSVRTKHSRRPALGTPTSVMDLHLSASPRKNTPTRVLVGSSPPQLRAVRHSDGERLTAPRGSSGVLVGHAVHSPRGRSRQILVGATSPVPLDLPPSHCQPRSTTATVPAVAVGKKLGVPVRVRHAGGTTARRYSTCQVSTGLVHWEARQRSWGDMKAQVRAGTLADADGVITQDQFQDFSKAEAARFANEHYLKFRRLKRAQMAELQAQGPHRRGRTSTRSSVRIATQLSRSGSGGVCPPSMQAISSDSPARDSTLRQKTARPAGPAEGTDCAARPGPSPTAEAATKRVALVRFDSGRQHLPVCVFCNARLPKALTDHQVQRHARRCEAVPKEVLEAWGLRPARQRRSREIATGSDSAGSHLDAAPANISGRKRCRSPRSPQPGPSPVFGEEGSPSRASTRRPFSCQPENVLPELVDSLLVFSTELVAPCAAFPTSSPGEGVGGSPSPPAAGQR